MASVRRAKRWPNAPKKKPKPKPKKVEYNPFKDEPTPELRKFQRDGVEFLKEHNWNVLLADAPGVGKTPQALIAIGENAKKLCPALVVVPPSVLANWKREAKRWIPGIRVQTLGKMKTRLRPRCHLTITTWDVLAARQTELLSRKYKCIIADEAHYAKNPESQRSLALQALADKANHLLLLTGTPMLNDVEELRVLEGLFGTPDPPMLRRLLEDVAKDIPPKRRVTLYTDIPADVRAEYEQVVSEFDGWLEEYLPRLFTNKEEVECAVERTLAAEPLAKLSYLRRILGRGKVPGAAAWIRAMQKRKEPVVVFGHFQDVMHLLGQALSKLGIAYVRLDGTCSQEQRQAAVDAFQTGQIDVFLGTSAAREGITLHRAAHMLRLERDYVPAYEEQAEDRIRRIGQTRRTTIWYMHTEGTIDDRIADVVDRKRAIVAREVGIEDIEHIELDEVMNVWRKIKELKKGVPLVRKNPKADIDMPKLPSPKRVHSILIDTRAWPLDAVQRYLRRRGYRQRKIERQGFTVKVTCRSRAAFINGKVRKVRVGIGMAAEVGKPATSSAVRMKAVRKVQKVRRVKTMRRKKNIKKWTS
jgi:SNF2 family DNA or RNA helicase